jgi:hypothetical protein
MLPLKVIANKIFLKKPASQKSLELLFSFFSRIADGTPAVANIFPFQTSGKNFHNAEQYHL